MKEANDFMSLLHLVSYKLKKLDGKSSKFCSKWVPNLVDIFRWKSVSLKLQISTLGTLKNVLFLATEESVDASIIVGELFQEVWNSLWNAPKKCPDRIGDEDGSILEVNFDEEGSVNCEFESPVVAVHGPGGKGFCISDRGFCSGIFQWQIRILRENAGNEGTCLGISLARPRDYSHRSTKEMWLYRAYSGHLYHNGELKGIQFSEFTEQDVISVLLDLEDRTLSFAKNKEDFKLAFTNLPEGVSVQ